LLRSTIEDALRHIFYYDHVVEFEKLEQSPSSYETMNELWQYSKTHPRLEKTFERSKAIDFLENKYAVFSKYVHSGDTSHMNLTNSLSKVEFDKQFFEEYSKEVLTLAGYLNFSLFKFYQKTIACFNPPWKNYVISMIKPSLRRLI
jgi:hypothetical protein